MVDKYNFVLTCIIIWSTQCLVAMPMANVVLFITLTMNIMSPSLFSSECITKFGEVLGNQVWEAVNDCFDVLPLAATVDDRVRTFRVHSGA